MNPMPELDAEHRNQMAEAMAKDHVLCDPYPWNTCRSEPCADCRREAQALADALAPLVAGWLADAKEAGARQGIEWLQADYPYGDMPDWRQMGVDWLVDRLAEERRHNANRGGDS